MNDEQENQNGSKSDSSSEYLPLFDDDRRYSGLLDDE